MNVRTRVVTAGLLAAVVGLGVALGVVLASGGGDGSTTTTNGMMNGNDGYAGMMRSMDMMDSDSMLSHMRDVLREAGYQRMLTHFRDHQNGTASTPDSAIDQMMHQMMDGMLQHMPMDSGGMMPGAGGAQRQTPNPSQQDAHHETPTSGTTNS